MAWALLPTPPPSSGWRRAARLPPRGPRAQQAHRQPPGGSWRVSPPPPVAPAGQRQEARHGVPTSTAGHGHSRHYTGQQVTSAAGASRGTGPAGAHPLILPSPPPRPSAGPGGTPLPRVPCHIDGGRVRRRPRPSQTTTAGEPTTPRWSQLDMRLRPRSGETFAHRAACPGRGLRGSRRPLGPAHRRPGRREGHGARSHRATSSRGPSRASTWHSGQSVRL